MCNAFEPRPASEGGDKDVFLIAAVSANDPQELAWADEAQANGNYLVGIGPSNNDGLRDRCDAYFDDRCDEVAGWLSPSPVSPIRFVPPPVFSTTLSCTC